MSRPGRVRRAVITVVGLVLTAAACGKGGDDLSMAAASGVPTAAASSGGVKQHKPFASVPTVQECEKALRVSCYTADMVRTAYGIDRLNAQGLTGKGRTIAIFATTVPPTLEKDLEEFSRAMKLPRPDLTIRQLDTGVTPAPFDPADETMAAQALEATLDVQMAHMTAPDARLVVAELATPRAPRPHGNAPAHVPAAAGKQGGEAEAELFAGAFTEAFKQDNPDVLSVSYASQEFPAAGDTEEPVAAYAKVSKVFADLVRQGTTLVSGAGDWGAAPPVGEGGKRVRTASWPASDPNFLSLGGSRLHLDADGRRAGPDTVWNDLASGHGATGGGPSQTFGRPAYQNAVRDVVGERRGTPDLSMDGAVSGATLIYESFLPAGAGWIPMGGTSEATPLFAAVVALADQKAGERLGDIHDELYRLARDPKGGIVDITEGDNGPDGFQAAKGYDLASGLGTIDASVFVPALARLAAR